VIDRLLDPIVRRLLRPPRRAPRALPADLADRAEDVTIDGTRHPMKGWFLGTDGARGAVVVVHGWGSDAGRSSGLARSLIGAGLDVLLVDLPGHGRTGPVPSYDVVRMLEDIEASRRWMATRNGAGLRPGLLGISFGGVGAYAAASRERSWAALALLAAPMGPLEATALYLEAKRVPRVLRGAMLGAVGRVILAAGQEFRGPECLARIEAPVLIVHGTDDRVVPIAHAQALASARQAGQREVHWVPGGGHELTDDPETGRRISRFFARTVGN
jgi:alpha-beta hydrolase superfamily lysophospholipase